MKNNFDRRQFISTASVAGLGVAVGLPTVVSGQGRFSGKPAILGGTKAFTGHWPGWPVFGQAEQDELLTVLNSGNWCRLGSKTAPRFEEAYEKLTGARHALAVSSGTSALYTMLGALDIGPGDEVIIPPYTFIATYNVVVLNYALPIFVDTDIESFQIDAGKIEGAITGNTKVILPVHIGGSPADLDTILAIAGKHHISVLEDACQAHLAEWRGKSVGTWGLGGAFSFQGSKNLNSGEGGAIISQDEQFIRACYSFHHQGQSADSASLAPGSGTRGSNLRLTEFQAGILLAQMTRLEEQVKRRWENALYLTKLLKEIPGIEPAKLYEGVTRSAYHLYMFRYDKEKFSGMDRATFIKSLNAEGIPCSGGYGALTKDSYVRNLSANRHYVKIYGEKRMQEWLEGNTCPENDRLSEEQAVWFYQTMLLGSKTDMDQIVEAILKIQKHSREISKV
jgi:perosamine synthetase